MNNFKLKSSKLEPFLIIFKKFFCLTRQFKQLNYKILTNIFKTPFVMMQKIKKKTFFFSLFFSRSWIISVIHKEQTA